ncbi:LacI family DNA-binding transcriptional regulator [soil metagenome]
MRSTIEDVARLANVSIATVSRFTSGQSSLISTVTQQRLQTAIEHLNYIPNAAARTLKTGRTRLIGVILADVSHANWSAMLGGIEAGSRELGYGVLISSAHNSVEVQQSYLETFLQHGVDGILLNPAAESEPTALDWARVKTPVIQLDRGLAYARFPVVAINNAMGASAATHHLLEAGHRKVGIVSWEIAGLSNRQERLDGFLSTMHDAGADVPDRFVAIVNERNSDGDRGIYDLMNQSDPPTAIFTANMELSLVALRELKRIGLCVPAETSIVGFDDPDWAALVDPPLTTVATSPYRIGRLAALRLCRAIEQGRPVYPRHSKLAPVLMIRDSVVPPPRRLKPKATQETSPRLKPAPVP